MAKPIRTRIARITAGCVLIAVAAARSTHAEGLEEPLPSMAELEASLQELGRHFEEQQGVLENHLHAYGERWEKEHVRFLRETEELRVRGEKALDEFSERAQRFLEENEDGIELRLDGIRESVEVLGTEWMERLGQWQRELGGRPERQGSVVETHLIQPKHRPASEIAAELSKMIASDRLAVMNERAIVFRGDLGEFARVSEAVRELDVLEHGLDSIKLVVSVVAAGGDWTKSRPLPERFAPIRDGLVEAAEGAPLTLLDSVTCLTQLDEELVVHSYLPDALAGTAQQYQLHIRRVEAAQPRMVRLDRLHFKADVFVADAMRPIHLEASSNVSLGKPSLLGTGSIRGAGEALLLVVEVYPAP